MAKLIDITGKPLSGEWGTDDEIGKGIPVLRTTNFTNIGAIDYRNVVTRSIIKKNLDEKFLRDGDIIIEKSGGSDKFPVGRVVYFDGEEKRFLFNNFTGVLRVKDKDVWYPRYVFYALYENYRRGGTRPFENKTTGLHNLKIDDYVSRYEVKHNTYNKQVLICNYLDILFGIMKKREKQLEKMDKLIKARFVEMFGEGLKDDGKFNLKPISEIGQVVSGATPKTSRHEYWNGNNVWITPAELSDESFVIYDSERKLTYEGVDSCAVTLLPVGTVILSSRAPIGKVAIAGAEMYCNQGFKNIIPGNEISSIYLYELLKMETEYLKSLGRGATFKEISKKIVENIRVKVPPIGLQNEFATFVEQVNKSKVEVQKALDKAQLLFDSLMQKYFG